MVRVLITAFEPYDQWSANASWQALVELTRHLPPQPQITTRLYPVDFEEVRKRLENDLEANYDIALHLGQAPGTARIQLESVGINIGGKSSQLPEEFRPLVHDGPIAYRSQLPLGPWSQLLRDRGFPATVSYHAGTFLCNATLYLSHYFAERRGLATRSAFVHLPLTPEQVLEQNRDLASLPAPLAGQALLTLLEAVTELA